MMVVLVGLICSFIGGTFLSCVEAAPPENEPLSLIYNSYFGGGGRDYILGVELDASGNIYLAGETAYGYDFPITAGAVNQYESGFISKISPNGRTLLYSSLLGGSDGDAIYDIAVDDIGNIYVVGSTWSPDFPTTTGAYDRTPSQYGDVFICKLDATTFELSYSTRLGGSGAELPDAIAIDAEGCAYVIGRTGSADLPMVDAFNPHFDGPTPSEPYIAGGDGFIAKISADGANLEYCSYIGGSGADYASCLIVDESGQAFVGGYTSSSDFYITPGAFDTQINAEEGFILKLMADGTLDFASFLGGSGIDSVEDMAFGPDGSVYITGSTESSDFPHTLDALNPALIGETDAFITKIQPDGSGIEYSTYLGGSYWEVGKAIGVDEGGNIVVGGRTNSRDFPLTAEAAQTTIEPNEDRVYCPSFLMRLNLAENRITYSTYLGHWMYGGMWDLEVDSRGNIICGGDAGEITPSSDAYSSEFQGGYTDGFFCIFMYGSLPYITQPIDITYEETWDHPSITWTVFDATTEITQYSIYIDDMTNPVREGTWISNDEISIPVGDLPAGAHVVRIVVKDGRSGESIDDVQVNVLPFANPVLSQPSDVASELATQVSWTVTDPTVTNPTYFIRYKDSEQIASGSWTSGVPITLAVDSSWTLGDHTVIIHVEDGRGGSDEDDVNVNVRPVTPITISQPDDITCELAATGIEISWILSDDYVEDPKYQLLHDGTLIKSDAWQPGVEVTIGVDTLTPGAHTYEILAWDANYDYATDEVVVVVAGPLAPIICFNFTGYTTVLEPDFQRAGSPNDWYGVYCLKEPTTGWIGHQGVKNFIDITLTIMNPNDVPIFVTWDFNPTSVDRLGISWNMRKGAVQINDKLSHTYIIARTAVNDASVISANAFSDYYQALISFFNLFNPDKVEKAGVDILMAILSGYSWWQTFVEVGALPDKGWIQDFTCSFAYAYKAYGVWQTPSNQIPQQKIHLTLYPSQAQIASAQAACGLAFAGAIANIANAVLDFFELGDWDFAVDFGLWYFGLLALGFFYDLVNDANEHDPLVPDWDQVYLPTYPDLQYMPLESLPLSVAISNFINIGEKYLGDAEAEEITSNRLGTALYYASLDGNYDLAVMQAEVLATYEAELEADQELFMGALSTFIAEFDSFLSNYNPTEEMIHAAQAELSSQGIPPEIIPVIEELGLSEVQVEKLIEDSLSETVAQDLGMTVSAPALEEALENLTDISAAITVGAAEAAIKIDEERGNVPVTDAKPADLVRLDNLVATIQSEETVGNYPVVIQLCAELTELSTAVITYTHNPAYTWYQDFASARDQFARAHLSFGISVGGNPVQIMQGDAVTFPLTITNNGGSRDTYSVAILGVDNSWSTSEAGEILVDPFATASQELTLQSSVTSLAGEYVVRVIVLSSLTGQTQAAEYAFSVTRIPPVVRIAYSNASLAGSYPGSITFSASDTFGFPLGWYLTANGINGNPAPGPTSDYWNILPTYAGHDGVLQMLKGPDISSLIAVAQTPTMLQTGSIEFWAALEGDSSVAGGVGFTGSSGLKGVVGFQGGELVIVDAQNNLLDLGPVTPGWHHIRIDFTPIAVVISVDSALRANLQNEESPSITGVILAIGDTAGGNGVGTLYIDALGFSWDSRYILGSNLAPSIDITPRDYAGEFAATFTFTPEDRILFSQSWQSGPTSYAYTFLPQYQGHTNVLRLESNEENNPTFIASLGSPTTGTIEFWAYLEGSPGSGFALMTGQLGGSSSLQVYFIMRDGMIATLNADDSYDIRGSASMNAWHHYRLDFAGPGETYLDLEQNHFRLTVDQVPLGVFALPEIILGNALLIATGTFDAPGSACFTLDAMGVSWDSNYQLGDNLQVAPSPPVPEVWFEEGDPAATLSYWISAVDTLNPAYRLFDGNNLLEEGSWTSQVPLLISLSTLPPGDHPLTLVADDGLGGVATTNVIVHVTSTEPPVITYVGFNPVVYDGDPTIPITIEASCAVDISSVTVTLGGITIAAQFTGAVYQVVVPNPALTGGLMGMQTFTVTVTAANGLTTIGAYEFDLRDDDGTGPNIGITVLEITLNPTGGFDVSFAITAEDLESGIDFASIDIWVAGSQFTTLGTHVITMQGLSSTSIVVTAKNGDLDRGVIDQEESTASLDITITTDLAKQLILSSIDTLILHVQDSSDTDWMNPADNRKAEMIAKLEEVKALVAAGDYAGAYDKFLHDVKPKLTGLKTDEDEIPWGNGLFNNPWVTSPALQQAFRDRINPVLREIRSLADTTPAPPCPGHHGHHAQHHHAQHHHAQHHHAQHHHAQPCHGHHAGNCHPCNTHAGPDHCSSNGHRPHGGH